MKNLAPRLVSIHGAHSGEFCTHAENTLEELVQTYIRKGFSWVGITEHMPPAANRFRYPDEVEAGLDATGLYQRFGRYMTTARALQKKYASRITLYIGFETETYSGSFAFIESLVRTFTPDYIVGSVHHVNDIGIDWSQDTYDRIAQRLGGREALYRAYFDLQHEMLLRLNPQVVGHFDLVRIFDDDYRRRLRNESIRRRIRRNLELIKRLNLTMDLNMRSLQKGGTEPYIARPILEDVLALGIPVVPGDDAHSVATVGLHIEEGIQLLQEMGFDTEWRTPAYRVMSYR